MLSFSCLFTDVDAWGVGGKEGGRRGKEREIWSVGQEGEDVGV